MLKKGPLKTFRETDFCPAAARTSFFVVEGEKQRKKKMEKDWKYKQLSLCNV